MKTLTFREFQATAKVVRLAEVDGYGDCLPADSKATGVMYEGGLCIEDARSWPDRSRATAPAQWYLLLGNGEFMSDDRSDLEQLLYEYGAGECFEAPEGVTFPEGEWSPEAKALIATLPR